MFATGVTVVTSHVRRRAGRDDLPVVLERLPRPAAGDVLPGEDLARVAADAQRRLLLRQLPRRRTSRTSPTGWPARARRSSTASAGSRPRTGAPLIDGVLGYVDCTIDRVHEAGDHYIVVGRVQELDIGDGSEAARGADDSAAVPPRRLHPTRVVLCHAGRVPWPTASPRTSPSGCCVGSCCCARTRARSAGRSRWCAEAWATPVPASGFYALVNRLVVNPVARSMGVQTSAVRLELVGSQLIGLAMLRYVLEVEPIASLEVDDLVPLMAPPLRAALTGRGSPWSSRVRLPRGARRRPLVSDVSARRCLWIAVRRIGRSGSPCAPWTTPLALRPARLPAAARPPVHPGMARAAGVERSALERMLRAGASYACCAGCTPPPPLRTPSPSARPPSRWSVDATWSSWTGRRPGCTASTSLGSSIGDPVPLDGLALATGLGAAGGQLTGHDVDRVEGLHVTTPLRTALDLGRLLPPGRAIGAMDAPARGRVVHAHPAARRAAPAGRHPRSGTAPRAGRAGRRPVRGGLAESTLRLHWNEARLPTPVPGMPRGAPAAAWCG